jgi:hypothetical protein
MEKEFIPYEEALALKELGFDEPCFGFYHEKCDDNNKSNCSGEFQNMCGWVVGRENTNDLSSHDFIIVTPLWQQAFRWFREKHNLTHAIDKYDSGHTWGVYENGYVKYEIDNIIEYDDAELDSLKKLIELLKEK